MVNDLFVVTSLQKRTLIHGSDPSMMDLLFFYWHPTVTVSDHCTNPLLFIIECLQWRGEEVFSYYEAQGFIRLRVHYQADIWDGVQSDRRGCSQSTCHLWIVFWPSNLNDESFQPISQSMEWIFHLLEGGLDWDNSGAINGAAKCGVVKPPVYYSTSRSIAIQWPIQVELLEGSTAGS